MPRAPRSLALVLAALTAFACGSADDEGEGAAIDDPATLAERGESVYRGRCALCHSTGMFGAKPLPVSLQTAAAWVAELEARVAELEQADPDHYAERADTLQALLELEGEARFDAWLRAYIADPRLDRTESKMQRVELPQRDEDALVAWLLAQRP